MANIFSPMIWAFRYMSHFYWSLWPVARIISTLIVINTILVIAYIFLSYVLHSIFDNIRNSGYDKRAEFIFNMEDCPICYQKLCEPVRLQCGHLKCLECLTQYCRANQFEHFRCSMCRSYITTFTLLENYTPVGLPKVKQEMLLEELNELIDMGQAAELIMRILTAPNMLGVFLITSVLTYCIETHII